MHEQQQIQNDNGLYYRLIALWVTCEAFAGGLLHSIKLPFTGMIISSLAVMCIILIARFANTGGAILKATIIVALFKLLLSPHSPPTAYIAVFFQGLTGQLLFRNTYFFKTKAILLAVLSLVESAIQRILILLFMGSSFWKAVNQFIQKLTKQETTTSYSNLIAGGYILLHAVVGIIIGMSIVNLVHKSNTWRSEHSKYLITITAGSPQDENKLKRSKKLKGILVGLWLILLFLLLQAYFYPSHSFITLNEVTDLIIRFILILAAWYLFIAPLVMRLIKQFLQRQQHLNKEEMRKVMEMLPGTKYIFKASWQLSGEKKGYGRLKLFMKILMMNILADNKPINAE